MLKNELGEKRLKLSQDELDLKYKVINVREKEFKANNLQQYYSDLHKDLQDARDNDEQDEIKQIKEEKKLVQKQRRELNTN